MKNKIKLNSEPATETDIEKNKNFSKLVEEFKKKSIEDARVKSKVNSGLKKWIYTTVIAGATVVCTVSISQLIESGKSTNKLSQGNILGKGQDQKKLNGYKNPKTQKSKVVEPLNGKLNVPFSRYKVDATKGATLKHSSSTQIKIPSNAFTNKKGELINGEIEIQYREYHDVAAVIGSGIPMNYDSAATKFNFESAGMLEIKGYFKGEEILIRNEKKIDFIFASQKAGEEFNFYSLDALEGNWNFLGKDKVLYSENKNNLRVHPETIRGNKKSNEKNVRTADLQKKEAELGMRLSNLSELTLPEKPKRASSKRSKFRLEINPKEFPELQTFKNCYFEVDERNQNFGTEFMSIDWDDLKLERGDLKNGNYKLLLRLGRRVEELVVYPVFEGAEFENAQSNYETALENYHSAYELRKRLGDSIKFIHDLIQSRETNVELSLTTSSSATDYANLTTSTEKVSRLFSIESFGIYNCDKAIQYPQGEFVSAACFADGKLLSPPLVYLIPKDKKMVFTYEASRLEKLGFSKDENYSMLCIIQDKIYYCSSEAFQNRKLKFGKMLFQFENVSKNVSSLEQLKKIILS